MSEAVFHLPDVGEGLIEAEIVAWKVAVGDVVALNQPLVDIETAKAVVELPSPYAGVVTALHGSVGDVIEVDRPLITFEVGATSSDEGPSEPTAAPASVAPPAGVREAVLVGYGVADEDAGATRRRRRSSASDVATPVPAAVATTAPPAILASPRSTPPVRLYAKQHGVDLASVTGTGREGLITRADVERVLSVAPAATAAATTPVARVESTSTFVGREIAPWSTGPAEERIPVKGVLRSMSDAMVQSAFSAPHAAVWVRVDATRTMELLASLKQRPSLADVRLSPLTILALAVCDGARRFPGINSSFDAAAGEVVVRRVVNLGIAANTPRGLLVPNVKGADRMGLVEMATALNDLVDTARAGTTSPEGMAGTTLTITNVGMYQVDGAMPILPPGTGAILAVGQVVAAPWVVGGEVVVRQVVELSMSFDHRQIDGALASAFLAHVGRVVTDPAPYLIAG